MKRHANPILLPTLLSILLPGCLIYDPGLVPVVEADAGPAPGDAGPPPACDLRGPPTRPEGADDGEGEERVYVLRTLTLRQTEDDLWARTGYDLDGLCTRSPAFVAECTSRSGTEDGDDGIDNVFGARLFPLFELTINDYQDSMQAMHEEGRNALVLGVRGWNGEPNDPRVFVWAATTVSATSAGAEDATPPEGVTFDALSNAALADGAAAPAPTWDGRDWVWLREDSFASGDPSRPVITDDTAYVRDGVLVFDLPDRAEFKLFGVDVRPGRAGELLTSRVRLTSGTMTARLDPDGLTVRDGVIAGRWPMDDIFVTTQEVGVCTDDPLADLLSQQLNEMADVRDEPPGDGDALLPCNALSLGASFEATRVRVAGLAGGAAVRNVCAEIAAGTGG